MQNGGASETGTASKDIRFDCPHCSAPMVVCSTATVKLLDCPRCKKSVRIPRSVLTAMGQPVPPDASTPVPKPAMIAAASARKAPLTTSPSVTTSAFPKIAAYKFDLCTIVDRTDEKGGNIGVYKQRRSRRTQASCQRKRITANGSNRPYQPAQHSASSLAASAQHAKRALQGARSRAGQFRKSLTS